MTLLDEVETHAFPHGVRVQALELEQQPPHGVVFPLADGLFKGRYRVVAQRACTVLAHRHEIVLTRRHFDGGEHCVTIAAATDDARRSYGDRRWPYALDAGETREHAMVVTGVDIPRTLQRLRIADPLAAIASAELRFFIRIAIRIAGKPLDSRLEIPFRVTAPSASG